MSLEVSPSDEGGIFIAEGQMELMPTTSDERRSLSDEAGVPVEAHLAKTETDNSVEVNEFDRRNEIYQVLRDEDTYEVFVHSEVTAEDVEKVTHPDDWSYIKKQAEKLQGSTWVFINPTAAGGGVAMMRPPLVHDMKKLGIDAHWYVMEPFSDQQIDEMGNPFESTKKMHNTAQRMSEERITDYDKALHWYWADELNGPVLESQETIQKADFIVIDDPQPAPMIARLKRANPNAKFIWRNHIDTNGELMADPSTPQGEIASYLLDECDVRGVDAVMAHPVESFVHRNPDVSAKTYFGPATFDHFDNLNRHLNEAEKTGGIQFINAEIEKQNEKLIADGRSEDVQPLLNLDPDTKRITLIARFDPAKGMDKAMAMGVQTRQLMREKGWPEEDLPEIVIVGNGSVDDPDGIWMYDEIVKLRRERYPEESNKIIVMRLKHNYDAMNALMSRSSIITQTSDAEGLETRVSDAIKHHKPVVVSNRGGIKTQVVDGKSGIILDYDKPGYDLKRGAEWMAGLLTDKEAYDAMVESTNEQAREFNLRDFTTPANLARFLRIANRLNEGITVADRVWHMSEITAAERAHAEHVQLKLGETAVK